MVFHEGQTHSFLDQQYQSYLGSEETIFSSSEKKFSTPILSAL